MQQLKSKAIVLSRTNFGEADRIITIITPNAGKLRLMARGVRVLKSKLAGGIELFSISDISYIRGRSELHTLTSARLESNFAQILTDIERVQFGYELLKIINHVTEDETEPAYFELIAVTLTGLNDLDVPLSATRLWFYCHLLALSGHQPNLSGDSSGQALAQGQNFNFDLSSMSFYARADGSYGPEQIKFLRLAFSTTSPKVLSRVLQADALSQQLIGLVKLLYEHQL